MTRVLCQRIGALPSGVTTFVGRRQATTSLKRSLSQSRLVTLTGVGGVGKSRLAIHVAEAVRRGFSDGVYLVELADVKNAALVPHAIAATMDVRDQSTRSPASALVDYLRDKHLLIVLDNCEHLLDACGAIVSRVLESASEVRVLATSREPLNISGESVWPVPPLSVPNVEADESTWQQHSLSQYEAIALFQDRALAVVPGFALTPENRNTVVRLCSRLDGLPLAIELAAVRLRALTPQQILERLEHRFQLLTEGNRAALPRHQTLFAAISWSYDLCSDIERELWARCSIFTGGFDLEAAEHVCAGNGIAQSDIFVGIAGLVDKSIIIKSESARFARYQMLETIRQFGRDRLEESVATARLGRRHRDYYSTLVERSDIESGDSRQVEWAHRLEADRPNLWAALEFCASEPGESQAGLRMGAALWFYWIACGLVRDGRHWLERLLDGDDTPSHDRARALWVDGWAMVAQGDSAAGERRLEECLELAHQIDDGVAASHATQLLGVARMFASDPVGALPFLDDALARHRRAIQWTAPALVTLPQRALAAVMVGDIDNAMALSEECRQICAQSGELWVLSWVEFILGLTAWLSGNITESIAHLNASLERKRELNDQLGMPFCVELLAWVASARCDHTRAARLFGFADALWHRIGTPMFGYETLLKWSEERRGKSRRSLGDASFEELYRQGRAWPYDDGGDYVLGRQGHQETISADRPLSDQLTSREWEVAALVAEGRSNREIAAQLVVSQRTAGTHIGHILTKLGFHRRAQIASWFVAERTDQQHRLSLPQSARARRGSRGISAAVNGHRPARLRPRWSPWPAADGPGGQALALCSATTSASRSRDRRASSRPTWWRYSSTDPKSA